MAQTMEAVFKHGNYRTVDHTPGSAVAAGAVVVIEDKSYICHRAIAADELGALAAHGGVYSVKATGGSGGDVIAKGEKVYWNDGDNVAEEDSSGNVPLGWAAADKAETDTEMLVEHGAW